jgi:Ice-binding-like
MKRFEERKAYLVCMVIMSVFISILSGCGGGGGGHWNEPKPPVITAFSFVGFPAAPGTINEAAKTIAVTLPSGTAVTALTANFTTVAPSVKIGAAVQTSGTTANNFSAPQTYRVTATDGTFADYVVTVTVTPALNSIKTITAFSFVGFPASPGTINEAAKTIAVTLPSGTAVTALTANFTTVAPSVKIGTAVQTSGTTANNFSAPQTYRVTATDGTFVDYVVTVTLGLGPPPVLLGLAGNYAIFADTGISNATTPAAVTGDIGVGPGVTSTAITGFALTLPAASPFATSAQVTGKVYAFDYALPTPTNVTTASQNMLAAYNDAAGRTAGVGPFLNAGGGNIGGLTLAPGIYTWGTAVTLPFGTNVTLSGGPNDVWIFQIAGNLTTGANTSVLLLGGAQPKNIFWQVAGSSVTLGATAHFEGVVLAKFAINFGSLATANSRLLAQTAVNLDQNSVTQPAP